jgi:hypothetical protein
MVVDRSEFACSPVFFADAYCPACDTSHRWFAREAWIEDQNSAKSVRVAEAA